MLKNKFCNLHFIITKRSINLEKEQYLPYGELFVSQSLNGYDARYKFTGKERDEETGYDYFGARYYDSDLSFWLSVDPMASERSWVSPYSYCQNNPIGRIDPTGALDGWYNDENGTTTYDANINSQADLNSAGIKGSYVGQTFSGTMSNGWGVSGDAKGNLSMSLPEISISANKNTTPFLYSNTMNNIGYALSAGSIGTSSAMSLNKYGSNLLNDGKFFANYKGNPYEWSMNFYGNKSVPSTLVAAQKSRFLTGMKVLSWPGFKYAGTGFSILGTGVSAAQFMMSDDPAVKLETGFDFGMGLVGFAGLPGAAVSGLYFGAKPLIKLQAPYVNQATSGFSEFGMGFHSINLMPTK
ncbi:MAG: RHS repeat-associated core domain-containing protein [Bacteroidales bacterium]|nr:RHS repeat-associated core domain-containing protein [Bacteroidales bacterium]